MGAKLPHWRPLSLVDVTLAVAAPYNPRSSGQAVRKSHQAFRSVDFVWLRLACAPPVDVPVTPQEHRHRIPDHLMVVAHPVLGGLHHEY